MIIIDDKHCSINDKIDGSCYNDNANDNYGYSICDTNNNKMMIILIISLSW
jgi:hypothetical protein